MSSSLSLNAIIRALLLLVYAAKTTCTPNAHVFHNWSTRNNNNNTILELVCEMIMSHPSDPVPKSMELALDKTGLKVKSDARLSSAADCTEQLQYTPLRDRWDFTDRTNKTAVMLRRAGTRCEVDTYNRLSRTLRIVMLDPEDILLQPWTCTITPKARSADTTTISYDNLARSYSSRVPTHLHLNIQSAPHAPFLHRSADAIDQPAIGHEYFPLACSVDGLDKVKTMRKHSPPDGIIPSSPIRFVVKVANNSLNVLSGMSVIVGDIYGRNMYATSYTGATLDRRKNIWCAPDAYLKTVPPVTNESLPMRNVQTSCFDDYPRERKYTNLLSLGKISCADYGLLVYDTCMKSLPGGRMNNVVPTSTNHVLEVDDLLTFLDGKRWCAKRAFGSLERRGYTKYCEVARSEPIYQRTFNTNRIVIKIPEPVAVSKCIRLSSRGDPAFIGLADVPGMHVFANKAIQLCPTAQLWSEYYAAVAMALLKYQRITLKLIKIPLFKDVYDGRKWIKVRSDPTHSVHLSCPENESDDRQLIFIANGRCADDNVRGKWCGDASPYAVRRVTLRAGRTWRVAQKPHTNRHGKKEYNTDMTCMWRAYLCVDKLRPKMLPVRELLLINNKMSYGNASYKQGPFDVMPNECIYTEMPGADKRTVRICDKRSGGNCTKIVRLDNFSTVFRKKMEQVAHKYGSNFRAAIPFGVAVANLDRLCPCRTTINTCSPFPRTWMNRTDKVSLSYESIIGTTAMQTSVLSKLLALNDNVHIWCEALGRRSMKLRPSELMASSVCSAQLPEPSMNMVDMVMKQHLWMLPKPRLQTRRGTGLLNNYVQLTCDGIPRACSKNSGAMSSLMLLNMKTGETLAFYHDEESKNITWRLIVSHKDAKVVSRSGNVKSRNDSSQDYLLPQHRYLLYPSREEVFGVMVKRSAVKTFKIAQCAYGLNSRVSSPPYDLRKSIDKAESVCLRNDHAIHMSRGGDGVITCMVTRDPLSPCEKPSVSLTGTGVDNFGRSKKLYSALCVEPPPARFRTQHWLNPPLSIAEMEGINDAKTRYCRYDEQSVYVTIVTGARESRLQYVKFKCAYSLQAPVLSNEVVINYSTIHRDCVIPPQQILPEIQIDKAWPTPVNGSYGDVTTTRLLCRYPKYLGDNLCATPGQNESTIVSVWADITSFYTRRKLVLLAWRGTSTAIRRCTLGSVWWLTNCSTGQLPDTEMLSITVTPLAFKEYANLSSLEIAYRCGVGTRETGVASDTGIKDPIMADAVMNLRQAVLNSPPRKPWDVFVTFATPSNRVNPDIFLALCQIFVVLTCLLLLGYIMYRLCDRYLAKRTAQ